MLFLISTPSGTRYFTLPHDDNNYVVIPVDLVDSVTLKASIVTIGVSGGASGYGSSSNPIPTNGGKANVTVSLRFTSSYTSAVTVGAGQRFKIRVSLGNGFGDVEMIGATTVPANTTTHQATFTANQLFSKAISMLKPDVTSTSTTMRIQVQDTTSATKSWQQIAEQTVYFKR